MSEELLVEVTRNDTVESRHFGSAVVCDYTGKVLFSWGDIERLIFPRSALKPFLAMSLVESGASDHYDLSDAELALACASHQGESIHQELVIAWLDRMGLNQDHLACGADLPDDIKTAHGLLATGKHGSRAHHNCSGKHAGFLTTALHLGMPLEGFHLIDHPLQQLSLEALSELSGIDFQHFPMGIDGCGFPAPTMPLVQLGHAVARYAKPLNLSETRTNAIQSLQKSLIREPLFAAGHGTVVTDLNQITKGKVLAKTGAEGILTAALPEQGIGIALKICDGNARARSAALLAILNHLGVLTDEENNLLHAHRFPHILNSRGQIVGNIRPASSWLPDTSNLKSKNTH